MKNSQKGFAVPLIIAIIAVLAIGGGMYYYKLCKNSFCFNKSSQENTNTTQVTNNNSNTNNGFSCNDSDGGDDYYTKGSVDAIDPLTIKEGNIVKVLSPEKATMRMGASSPAYSSTIIATQTKEVSKNGVYFFTQSDQVYYSSAHTNDTNGNVLVDMPNKITVNKINFVGVGDANNSIEIVRETSPVDQCVGNVLVENSCVRGINTGYVCSKGCNQGACIR